MLSQLPDYRIPQAASLISVHVHLQINPYTGTWNYAFYGSAGRVLCSALVAMGLHRMPLPRKRSEAAKSGAATVAAIDTRTP